MLIDSTKYISGIPLIDNQHKEYIVLVNRLIAESKKGSMERKTLNNHVNEIVAFALEHFDAEEFIMRSAEYPLYEEHLAKHNAFRDKMDEFLEELETKEINIDSYVNELCEWLVDWFNVQVLDDDIKLVKFLHEKNITNS